MESSPEINSLMLEFATEMADQEGLAVMQLARNSYSTNAPWTLRFKLGIEEGVWTGATLYETLEKARKEINGYRSRESHGKDSGTPAQ